MTDCCGYDDYEAPTLFKQKIVKSARKEHKCCECLKSINKGDSYEYSFGVWVNEAETFKTCNGCFELKRKHLCCGAAFGWLFADLLEQGLTKEELGIT